MFTTVIFTVIVIVYLVRKTLHRLDPKFVSRRSKISETRIKYVDVILGIDYS